MTNLLWKFYHSPGNSLHFPNIRASLADNSAHLQWNRFATDWHQQQEDHKIIFPPAGTGPWSPPSAGCRHCPRRTLPPAASGRSGTGPSTAPRARPRWWRGAAAPLRPPRTPPPPQLRPDQLPRRPPAQLRRCCRQRPPPPPGRRSLQRTRKILWCCEYGSPLSLKHLYYYNHFIIFDFKS